MSLPQYSVLFPDPGASKAKVVAQAHSYQLYKDTSLVVARMTSDRSGIRLRNGQVIGFGPFANLLGACQVGFGKMWTLLAIPRASGALLSAVLQVVNGPVLATNSDVYKTPDGRLLAAITNGKAMVALDSVPPEMGGSSSPKERRSQPA
ncbi:hypothetical protein [Saccharopolyspora spinosa]|uniref:hypothetical protein n=1 Tax=Saccharopolyspora spinosa TaxID=60894 RepID=UPI00376EC93E